MQKRLPALLSCMLLVACSGRPLTPWTDQGPPLMLAPATQTGVIDRRGRFREIACAVIDEHGREQPAYRPCGEALTRIGSEPGATGEPVELSPSKRGLVAAIVPGIGWDCFSSWLDLEEQVFDEAGLHGFRAHIVEVEGLSGSTRNAGLIRDRVLAEADRLAGRQLVLMGYSKGTPDILEAIVAFPEIRPHLAAVVSMAGAVGGSPLANGTTEGQLDLLRHAPKAGCSKGDDQAVSSLRPDVRRAWLAANPLPADIPFYSVVALPGEDRISTALRGTHRKLARIDPRNDGQLLAWDQIIPGSTLIGYLNADHWAVAVPIAAAHPWLGKTFVDHNAYPRRTILEAVLRFVEEDLGLRSTPES